MTQPSPDLRVGQTVDIEGDMTTLPDGTRALTNVTVWGYTDQTGNLLYHGPLIKGLFAPITWQWKTNLTVTTLVSDSRQSLESDTYPDPPGGINTDSSVTVVPCLTIAQAMTETVGTVVEIQSHPISSVGTGSFVLGEDGNTDTLTVNFTGTVTQTDRVASITGTIDTTDGTDRVLDIDSGPNFNEQESYHGTTLIASHGTIAWVKTWADGYVLVSGDLACKVVTGVWEDYFYIQDADRTGGIRVEGLGSKGSLVDVLGTLATDSDGERYLTSTLVSTGAGGSTTAKPYGMNNKALSVGLSTKSLPVKTWGKVTSVTSTGCYINDGSNLTTGNPTGTTGAFISWAALPTVSRPSTLPSVGTMLLATGIAKGATPSGGATVAIDSADGIVPATGATWSKDPAPSIAKFYRVTDTSGNAITNWLPFPSTGSLKTYVNGAETQFSSIKKLVYQFKIQDANGRDCIDSDIYGYSAKPDVCLVNNSLATERTSAFPSDSGICSTGYYYPDAWYNRSLGFNTDKTGGLVKFTPEAEDFYQYDPLTNLRSYSGYDFFDTNVVFDFFDVAGGTPTTGHTGPSDIVLQGQDSNRQDVQSGNTSRVQFPIRIETGRFEGPGYSLYPASGNYFYVKTGTSTWAGTWDGKPLTTGTDSVTFAYGKITNGYVYGPSITDYDYYTTMNPDGTVKTDNKVDDYRNVFYRWDVVYQQNSTIPSKRITKTYYTDDSSLTLYESDFSGGWVKSTSGHLNVLTVDVTLVNPTDRPVSSTYYPDHCWFQDDDYQLSHVANAVVFAQ